MRLRILAVSAAVVLALGACSDDDSDTEQTQPPGETSSTTVPESVTTTTTPTTTTEPEEAVGDPRSAVTSVEVQETVEHGMFGGTAYSQTSGQIQGVVGPDEEVVGLDGLALDEEGLYPYSASFQLIAPADGSAGTVVVEAENRGNGLLPGLLGEDFLFGGGRAYARVAWQTELNPDVPEAAQGVGEVIVRDFGRLLRDGQVSGADSPLGAHEHRILGGWSQGAWFAGTFVAEGFNVDPLDGSGVYGGVVAVSGAGSMLAINGFGDDGRPQVPYIRPDAAPLPADGMLKRPASDPLYVDVANYTDFYRLRAGLTSGADVDGYWRYDWPSPHAPGVIVPEAIVFENFGCNDGVTVPTNPTDFRPYLRALLVGLEQELGAPVADAQAPASAGGLPGIAEFDLTDEQPDGTGELNPLPGVTTPVPAVDEDLHPLGGVRFAASVAPLGSPSPVGLPPVTTAGITDVCGNFGGWEPFEPSEVQSRWATVEDYLAEVNAALEDLVEQGYVLPSDREAMSFGAGEAYGSAVSG